MGVFLCPAHPSQLSCSTLIESAHFLTNHDHHDHDREDNHDDGQQRRITMFDFWTLFIFYRKLWLGQRLCWFLWQHKRRKESVDQKPETGKKWTKVSIFRCFQRWQWEDVEVIKATAGQWPHHLPDKQHSLCREFPWGKGNNCPLEFTFSSFLACMYLCSCSCCSISEWNRIEWYPSGK